MICMPWRNLFSEDEIWAAIHAMAPDRAPFPDVHGSLLQILLFHHQGEEVELFCYIHRGGSAGFHNLNCALLILIPKKNH